MKVNIICDEADGGWIYSRFIQEIKKHSRHEILINEKDSTKYDVVHFIPYYTVNNETNIKLSTCWLSHQESKNPLQNKFVQAAKAVDIGISHSKKYAQLLRDQYHCNNIISVLPGIDLNTFVLRDVERTENKKMVVGYVGRYYSSSDRKNPALLKKISELPFVDFRVTGGKLDQDQIPQFYRSLDVVVSAAWIEGGPLAVQESLACGVPIIVMKDVGVEAEFKDGVIRAENGLDFIGKLKDLFMSKQYLTHWRQPSVMNRMRQQVEEQTWQKFVEEHDRAWEMITANNWRKTRE